MLRRGPLWDAIRALATVGGNRGLRALNTGWAASIAGEYLALTGLGVYGYGADGAAGVGIVAIAQMVPALLAAPFGAALGDLFRGERVLVVTEVLRSLAAVLAAVAVMQGAGAWVVYVLGGLLGLSRTAYYPAQAALIPLLAHHPREVAATSATLNLVKSAANLLAPALAGVLLIAGTPASVFAAAAVAFLMAAGHMGIRLPSTAGLRVLARETGDGLASLTRRLEAARRVPGLRLPLLLTFGQGLGRGGATVLAVLLPLKLLGLADSAAGFYSALVGLGGLAGVAVGLALVGRRGLAVPMTAGLALVGAPYVLPGMSGTAAAAAAALLVAGAGVALMTTTGLSLIVREAHDDTLSRVMGLQEGLRAAGIIVASIGVPFLSELVGLPATLIVLAATTSIAALAALPRARRVDADGTDPVVDPDVLAGLPLFEHLTPVARDRVARRMRRREVETGERVVAEGEAATAVYVVAAGAFAVTAGTRDLRRIGEGDVFGEIAVIEGGRRTATVTAASAGAVLELAAEDFLSAVLGHPMSSAEARALAEARLARGRAPA